MRSTGLKRAIRNASYYLGLHIPAKCIVEALAQHGVQVDKDLVHQVRPESKWYPGWCQM
jgi:hypothetical protein